MIAEDLQAMHSQCAEDPKDKDFDNSVVAQLIERTSQAEAERDEAKAESAACADFLDSMYSWECFWSDGWIIDDQQKISQAQENARQLKNYLVTSGHGVRLLRERDAAQARVKELEAQVERLTNILCGESREETADRIFAATQGSMNTRSVYILADELFCARAAEPKTEEPPQA